MRLSNQQPDVSLIGMPEMEHDDLPTLESGDSSSEDCSEGSGLSELPIPEDDSCID